MVDPSPDTNPKPPRTLGPPYKRPPITEAIIEIRYATSIDDGEVQKISSAFQSAYPAEQSVANTAVAVEVQPNTPDQPVAKFHTTNGKRRSSNDETELLLLLPASFVVSQLAPYSGWDQFFARFVRDWTTWKRATDYRTIIRVGLRFLNRIDIPMTTDRIVEESDYLRAYPKFPASFGTASVLGMQAQILPDTSNNQLTLNFATVPSPLLDHVSFVLDIDVSREAELPQNDEGVYTVLNTLRDKKNAVFEDSITDQARELFQK